MRLIRFVTFAHFRFHLFSIHDSRCLTHAVIAAHVNIANTHRSRIFLFNAISVVGAKIHSHTDCIISISAIKVTIRCDDATNMERNSLRNLVQLFRFKSSKLYLYRSIYRKENMPEKAKTKVDNRTFYLNILHFTLFKRQKNERKNYRCCSMAHMNHHSESWEVIIWSVNRKTWNSEWLKHKPLNDIPFKWLYGKRNAKLKSMMKSDRFFWNVQTFRYRHISKLTFN